MSRSVKFFIATRTSASVAVAECTADAAGTLWSEGGGGIVEEAAFDVLDTPFIEESCGDGAGGGGNCAVVNFNSSEVKA
jgi:hypothetical protein